MEIAFTEVTLPRNILELYINASMETSTLKFTSAIQ